MQNKAAGWQELSRARRRLRAQEFGADRRAPAVPLWYFGLGLEPGVSRARLGHTGLPCSAHSSAPWHSQDQPQKSLPLPRTGDTWRPPGDPRGYPGTPGDTQGTPGDTQGHPGDTRRWGQPLPEVLLCSRNSICSLCPLFSASARGTGHWGSPVAHVTAAPQKTRAWVSARSLVVTAAHRACDRAGGTGGELRACPRGCVAPGVGGETPGEEPAPRGRSKGKEPGSLAGFLPAATRAGQRRERESFGAGESLP